MKIFFGIVKYSALIVFGAIMLLTVGAYLNLPLPLKPLVVQTGSMSPTIPVGSLVLVTKKSPDAIGVNYVENDIITFKNGQELVSHRVTNVVRQNGVKYFQTKGDANNTVDSGLVAEKDVVGKVNFSVPYIGKFVNFVKQPLGFILLVTIPVLFVIISEVLTIIEEIRKKGSSKSSNLDFAKPLSMFFISAVFLTGTHAFFSSVATSTNNTFTAAASFPQKSNLFDSNPFTCATGAANTVTSFGSVTITKGTNLTISVTLTGATPSSPYDIWVNQDPGGCPLGSPSFPAALTTDPSGNATVTGLSLSLVGGATNFWISAVGGSQVLRSSAVHFN